MRKAGRSQRAYAGGCQESSKKTSKEDTVPSTTVLDKKHRLSAEGSINQSCDTGKSPVSLHQLPRR